jgi:hypothetical protein
MTPVFKVRTTASGPNWIVEDFNSHVVDGVFNPQNAVWIAGWLSDCQMDMNFCGCENFVYLEVDNCSGSVLSVPSRLQSLIMNTRVRDDGGPVFKPLNLSHSRIQELEIYNYDAGYTRAVVDSVPKNSLHSLFLSHQFGSLVPLPRDFLVSKQSKIKRTNVSSVFEYDLRGLPLEYLEISDGVCGSVDVQTLVAVASSPTLEWLRIKNDAIDVLDEWLNVGVISFIAVRKLTLELSTYWIVEGNCVAENIKKYMELGSTIKAFFPNVDIIHMEYDCNRLPCELITNISDIDRDIKEFLDSAFENL